MTKKIAILACLLLAGCSITNDEIISETKKCTDAGMEPKAVINGWTYEITKIVCYPPGDKP